MSDINTSPDKLKQSILQEAMQGKLTQQSSQDGDASDLLQSIDEEKQRLIKAGKIKKQKELAPIKDDEEPFSIPDNWKWSRLDSLVDINSGLNYKKRNLSNDDSDIRVIRGGNISNNYELILHDDDYRINDDFINNSNVFLRKNQIITPVSTSPKHTAKMAIVPSLNSKIATGGFIYQITPLLYKDILSKFLMYDLSCPSVNKAIKDSTHLSGSALCNLPKTEFRNIVIPIPPLAEQKRIVDKLDELLPKVASLKQSVDSIQSLRNELTLRLRRSLLQSAMQGKLTQQLPEDGDASDLLQSIDEEKQRLIKAGKIKKQKKLSPVRDDEIPFKIPDNWKWTRLGDIGIINTGNTPPKKNPKYYNSDDIEFVTPADIDGTYVDKVNRYLSSNALSKARIAIPNSIFVIGIGGGLGRVGIATKKVAFNQQLHNINSLIINFKYIYYCLISNLSQNQFNNKAGTAIPILNKTRISNTILPLPPLTEQKRIVDKLDTMFEHINNL